MISSRLDYGCQLRSPTKISEINKIDIIQRSFTKRIDGMSSLTYHQRLVKLNMYSHQRRRERYLIIIYVETCGTTSPSLSTDIEFSDIINHRCKLYETKHTRSNHNYRNALLCYDLKHPIYSSQNNQEYNQM